MTVPLPSRPNIVLVLADSMRARNVSCYGYHRQTTPQLDRLAAAGVRFTQAFAAAPFTVASTASILTGVHPSRHRLEHYRQRLDDSLVTLPELLRAAGYYTAAFVANPHINHQSGLTRGFTFFTDGRPWYKRPRALSRCVAWAESGKQLTRSVREQIAAAGTQPFFFFVFYNDSHVPFSDLPRFLLPLIGTKLHSPDFERHTYTDAEIERVKRLYDQALHRADARIGELHTLIQTNTPGAQTLFLVSADHGEGLDRRPARAGHGRLYENGIHVPLIVNGPIQDVPAREVSDLTSGVDLAPTICELTGADPSPQFQGRSFAPAIKGRPRTLTPEHIVSEYHDSRCVRTARWKLILRGPGIGAPATVPIQAMELYDVVHDPTEAVNLATQQPERVAELRMILETFVSDAQQLGDEPEPFEADEIVVERLRGLGYI